MAGSFQYASGLLTGSAALWDGTTWSALGAGPQPNWNGVGGLAVYNGVLYAGASSSYCFYVGAVCVSYGFSFNGTTWVPMGLGTNSGINDLAVYNNLLYAGGSFTTAGGLPVNYIASWNGSAWAALPYLGVGGTVTALLVYGDALYVAGSFTLAGYGAGIACQGLARFTPTGWTAVGAAAFPTYYYATTLAVVDGALATFIANLRWDSHFTSGIWTQAPAGATTRPFCSSCRRSRQPRH